MTWNLRLVNMAEIHDEPYIEIREVFYDQVGKPLGHTTATVGGEDKTEIKQYLEWALEALEKPVLTFKDKNGNLGKDY
jgi:hypothetical protein